MLRDLYYIDSEFNAFTLNHIILLICVTAFLLLMRKFFKSGFKDKNNVLRYTFIVLIILQQFGLYSWYYMNGLFNLIDAMPLYPCRIWQICMLLMLITDNPKLFPVTLLLGFPSAVIAFLLPDTGGLGFPNIMFVEYLIGHTMLMLVPMYEYYCRDMRLNEDSIKIAYKFILGYSVIAIIFNRIIGANYGYLSRFPFKSAFIEKLGPMYTVLYIIFAVSMTTLWYRILLKFQTEAEIEYEKN